MQNYAKLIVSGIIIATVSSIATFAWNSQSLAELVEQKNRETIIDCLTKARAKTTSQKILQATEHCNQNLFTTVSSPHVSTGNLSTGTATLTPVSEVPIGISIIPKTTANVTLKTANPVRSSSDQIRTPTQIYKQVKHLGYRESPTLALIQSCNEGSIDPRHCIIVGLTLMYNEAGNLQNSKACVTRNNCFGINSGKKSYSSLIEATDTWVVKYNKHWYKAKGASFFYSTSGSPSPSRYCTSEDSSKSSTGCPHGLSIATKKWNQLYPIIF